MPRPRLTPHQREVYERLQRRSARVRGGWVELKRIGSHGALEHLVEKGYAERDYHLGPRGGTHYWYRPTEAT